MSPSERQRLKESLAIHKENLKIAKRGQLTTVVAREQRIIARIQKKLASK